MLTQGPESLFGDLPQQEEPLRDTLAAGL